MSDIICNECNQPFLSLKGLSNHLRGGCKTNRHLQLNRKCPICETLIQYEKPSKFLFAVKNNSKCIKCGNIGRKVNDETKNKLSKILKRKIKEGSFIPNMLGAHSKESREKQSKTRTGIKLSESHKQKIRDSILNSEKYKTSMKSEERSRKLSIANNGRKHSLTTRKKMSLNHTDISGNNNPFYNKTHSQESKRKMRISFINRISQSRNNGYQISPNYNRNACQYFENLMKVSGIHIQHAMNGGEYYIKELGYFVDGYDEKNNVVYEWDENRHYDKFGNLNQKDIIRESEIKSKLNCKVIRIKESDIIYS